MLPCLQLLRAIALPVGLLALLAGCNGDKTPPSSGRMFGLMTGPLPQPQPFVVQSRHALGPDYPAVGVTPPARADTVLSVEDRGKLETDLKRRAKTPVKTPPETAANTVAKPPLKRKVVPPQT